MQFSTKTLALEKARAGCIVVPVLADRRLTAAGTAVDKALGGALASALASGDLPAKAGATLMLYAGGAITRVLLVSMGDAAEVAPKAYGDAARSAFKALATVAGGDALVALHEAPVTKTDLRAKVHAAVIAAREAFYRFDRMKSEPEKRPRGPSRVAFVVAKADTAPARQGLRTGLALANGVDLAKDLGNLPGNVCTPEYLAGTARELGKAFPIRVQVLDEKRIAALGMGALMAVAKGSALPPRLLVLEYRGGGERMAPVALVGKGITFDTGGISIKPAAEMDEMKFDMCGAASVLGTLRAVAEMRLPVNVVGIVPACENMPGGKATKPGDIVTSLSGQTIEILNTDAEGRLILCDALTYAARFKPSVVIDIATLTGACVVALGHHNTGMFTREDALAEELSSAGRDASDPCWRMPLDDAYQEQIKSPFADVANVGGRAGGAITAACFLARFAKGYEWAHLDIAGTAWRSGANKGSSGRPVPLLTTLLMRRAGA